MNYEILKAELALPAYAAMTDTEAADALNLQNITRIRESMSGSEMFKATDSAEYALLTDAKKAEWMAFCGIESIDPSIGGVAQDFVIYIFGGASTTTNTLGSLRGETISRAQEIGIMFVKPGHVQTARDF